MIISVDAFFQSQGEKSFYVEDDEIITGYGDLEGEDDEE